jgi:hypothetical protein
MLLPFAILVRQSASEPPEERTIGIDPESICRVEPAGDDPQTCWLYADGAEKPYRIAATADVVIEYVNAIYDAADDEREGERERGREGE